MDKAVPQTSVEERPPETKSVEAPPELSVKGDATGSGETAEGAPESKAPALDPNKVLDEAPADLLRSHPRLAGIVGDELKKARWKLERELKEQFEADLKTRQEQERLAELRRSDPVRFADEHERLEREQKERAQTRQKELDLQRLTYQEAFTVLTEFQNKQLPSEVAQKLGGKSYPGTWAQGFQAYLNEVADLTVNHKLSDELKKARAKWEKEELPALKKQLLSDSQAGDESPEVGGGQGTPGELTWDEFNAHRSELSWMKQNMDRVNRLLAASRSR